MVTPNGIGLANLYEHSRAMSTALTNSNNFYDNADLTQNFTYRKEWGFEFASAATAGKYLVSNT